MTKKKVLLIEDNQDICEIVKWVLEQDGYTVNVTSHLPATNLAGFKADLIVLDEWVNNNEGHMLCKEIKAIHDLRHIPVVIFSTAIDIEELMQTCGADGFVRKPFDIGDLVIEVNRLLA
ncbi:response regulator [Mucilaginibacter sp. CSA2-8R]|uniref:response regulator n=1 Tax=Mucilaginibacter sp. CSA2-8R TaxID=3141542 RepID=UPI00315C6434